MKKILIVIAFLLSYSAYGQHLSVFDVDNSQYPTMKAKFYAFDTDGKQILNIPESEFLIKENGVDRAVTYVSCPVQNPPVAISSLLTIDISGSMSEGAPNIDLAKTAATAWVNALPLGKSECALTSFDENSYLNRDFSQDRSRLLSDISKLTPAGGTDYDVAFMDNNSGCLNIANTGKYKKVVVFLTDGQPNFPPNELKIIQQAQNADITIFCITLGMSCPTSLRNIAKQTGGAWFENVTEVQEAEAVYLAILQAAQGGEPCEIEWESDGCDFYKEVTVEVPSQNLQAQFTYRLDDNILPTLEVTPSPSIRFEEVELGTSSQQHVTITAIGKPVTVVTATINNNEFQVVDYGGSNPPFTLNIGQSRDLTIEFTPIDSLFKFGKIEFESNACLGTSLYCSGGSLVTQSTLKVTHPNGDEVFVAGSDTIITWEGIMPDDSVQIEFSSDNGSSWSELYDKSINLKETWENIPKVSSKQCLIKVKQLRDLPTGAGTKTLTGHTGWIFSVCYSPDGSRIVSGCLDGTITLWDAYTGEKIRTLTENLLEVYSVSYSPDGSRIVSGSWNGIIKIWDANTGVEISELTGHTGNVFSVCYSTDGSRIASGSSDETIKIWDAETGDEIKTLSGHTSNANSVSYSPDGSRIASGSQDNTIKIWDAETGDEIKTLTGHTSHVMSVCYSPDGSRIASGSDDSTIKIWDAETGDEIKTLTGHMQAVWSVSYSPDGSKIASGSWDGTIKIWDTETEDELRTLAGHSDWVMNISYSPDGSRLASGSADETIKIWDVSEDIEQEDQSDNVFTIVVPEAVSKDVDFGEKLVGSVTDSVVTGFITNPGTYKNRIDSIYIDGGDADQFSLPSANFPFYVESNQGKAIEFRFAPTRVGNLNSQIIIVTQAGNLTRNISGIGVFQTLEIVTDDINFGKVIVGNTKDTTEVVLKNIGSTDITITATKQLGPDDIQFSVISGGTFTLAPDEEKALQIEFSPIERGRTSGQIGFEYNGVGSPAVTRLFGEGIIIGANATLRAGNSSAAPGDTVKIPIYLEDAKNLIQLGITGFVTTLKFDATILYPTGGEKGEVINSERYIPLTLPAEADENNILAELEFIAMLGKNTSTALELILDDTYAVGGTVEMSVVPGQFTLTGLCEEGDIRTFDDTEAMGLWQITPNPSSEKVKIEYTLNEEAPMSLGIYDVLGTKAKVLKSGNIKPGHYEEEFDISDLNNGSYFLMLKTVRGTVVRRIMVVK